MRGKTRPILLPRPDPPVVGLVLDLSVPQRQWFVSPDRVARRLWLANIEGGLPEGARGIYLGSRPAVRTVDTLRDRLVPVFGSTEASAASPVVILLEDGHTLLDDDETALWGLRATLSESPHIHVFATSPEAPTALVDYDAPFLEFFAFKAPSQVAGGLSKGVGPPLSDAAQIAHQLLGGGVEAELQLARAMSLTVDQTPDLLLTALDLMALHLEAQVDALSPQAQDVFAVVGSRPTAQTGAEVAAALGLGQGAASGQLRRLVQAGMLEDSRLIDEVTAAPRRRVGFRVRGPALALWAYAQTPSRRRAIRGWAALAGCTPTSMLPPRTLRPTELHPENLRQPQRSAWTFALRGEASRWTSTWGASPEVLLPWAPVLALGWGSAGTRRAPGPWCETICRAAQCIADAAEAAPAT